MRRILSSIMLIAVAAMATVSCQKEESPVSETKSVTLTLNAEVETTKTYIDNNAIIWGTGEYVQLYYNDGTDKYVKSKEDGADSWDGKSSASFTFDLTYEQADSYVLGGVYPSVVASISDSETSASSYKVLLPANQNATATSYDPAAFIMVMKPATVATIATDGYTAYFRRAVALNKITLTNVPEAVTSVEIIAPADKVLAGRRHMDLTTGESGEIYYGQTNAVTVNAAYAAGTVDVWFTSWGVELAEGEQLTIKMTSETKTYTRTITVRSDGIKFVEGGLNKLTVDMGAATEEILSNLAGEYLIAAMPGTWMLMSGSNAGSYYNIVESAVTSAEGDVVSSDFYGVDGIDACVWTLAKTDGGYSVQNNSTGKYLAAWDSGNSAKTSDEPATFLITINDDKSGKLLDATTSVRSLQYNSNNPRFAFYTTAQKALYFIPWVEDTAPKISVSAAELELAAADESAEFTFELTNLEGTPTITIKDGATISDIVCSIEGNTVNVVFAANEEGESKTATLVLSVDGVDYAEVTITQKAKIVGAVIEDGKYWIIASGKVAEPVSGTFGYLYVDDAWMSEENTWSSVQANAFEFTAVEGGYTIKDESGKYYYQTMTYNNFNVNATAPTDGSHIWSVVKEDDGTYKITNTVKSKYIQYSAGYVSFGSYDTEQEQGYLPVLVKVENPVVELALDASLSFTSDAGTQYITLPEGVTVVPSTDNTHFDATASGNVVTVSVGTATEAQSGTLTLVISYNGFSVTKTVALSQSAPAAEGEVTDVLTPEVIGISGSTYTSWSDKTATSSAVYAGQSSAGTGIQLRSSNNNSGIITTTSGGRVRKIVVKWNTNTANNRTLQIYGKSEAYSAPKDLYTSSQGTLLGTIVKGTSTELVIDGDYQYIGMRSSSGTMYLDEISITWGN